VTSTAPGGGVTSAVAALGLALGFADGSVGLSDLQAEERRRAAVKKSRDERFIKVVSKSANMKTGRDI
jgi:hypothetical protein